MKHLLARVVATAALVLLAPPLARADVLGTGQGSWSAWVSPTTGSGAFWENVTREGTCDATEWAKGTGNCSSPITGFYRDAGTGGVADVTGDWYGVSLQMSKAGLGGDFAASDGLGSTRKTATSPMADVGLDRDLFLLGFDDSALPVPEPATLALLGAGLVGLASAVRRRRG